MNRIVLWTQNHRLPMIVGGSLFLYGLSITPVSNATPNLGIALSVPVGFLNALQTTSQTPLAFAIILGAFGLLFGSIVEVLWGKNIWVRLLVPVLCVLNLAGWILMLIFLFNAD